MADDYQVYRLERIRLVTGTAARGAIPIIAIVGAALDSLGFVLCVGMLTEWSLLLINAVAAAVIGRWK